MKKLPIILFLVLSLNSFSQFYGLNQNYGALPTVVLVSATQGGNFCKGNFDGEVTDEGGFDVTERGFVYALTTLPDINDTKITSGSGLGSFFERTSDLGKNRRYYIRAYAINEKGISYSNQIDFATLDDASLTASSGSITPSSAIISGIVTENGNDVVATVCYYGTISGVYPFSAFGDGGEGAYSIDLTGLDADETYYYIVEPAGTGCPAASTSEQSFTTETDDCLTYDTYSLWSRISTSTCPNGVYTFSSTQALAEQACQDMEDGCVSGLIGDFVLINSLIVGASVFEIIGDSCIEFDTGYYIYRVDGTNTGEKQIIHLINGVIQSITDCP